MSKKDIVKYIIDEYGVTSPNDITNALNIWDMINMTKLLKKIIIVVELPKNS